jgi:hypothetical protein
MFQSETFRVALVEAACLFGIALLAVGLSPAKAAIYLVDQGDLQSQQCWPDCVSFGSLTGSITTDGTLGVGLSPSIITGWDLVLGDGVHTASLTTENSQITGNFPRIYYPPLEGNCYSISLPRPAAVDKTTLSSVRCR